MIDRTNIHPSDIKNQNAKFSDFKWPFFLNSRYNQAI